jgi:hypothetical protein
MHNALRLGSRCFVVYALAALVAASAGARHASAQAAISKSTAPDENAATRHHHPDVVQPPTRVVVVPATAGFDWTAAGIGASGAVGAVLLASGSALLLTRHKRRTVPTEQRREAPAV